MLIGFDAIAVSRTIFSLASARINIFIVNLGFGVGLLWGNSREKVEVIITKQRVI